MILDGCKLLDDERRQHAGGSHLVPHSSNVPVQLAVSLVVKTITTGLTASRFKTEHKTNPVTSQDPNVTVAYRHLCYAIFKANQAKVGKLIGRKEIKSTSARRR